ncbi:MAG: OmpP1/FadL family transporter [Kofleriaceae bacterium]
MRLRALGFAMATIAMGPSLAHAGGQFLPGSGTVSTSRAGAAVASADDGEALAVNPAGLAKTEGTTITLSAAMINFAMQFTRRGTYDDIPTENLPYEGMAYPTATNDVKPPFSIGGYQPVPVVAVVSDLGGVVPNLRVSAGLWAPNAYPFRDMCTEQASGCERYTFNGDPNVPPPPTRYDMIKQDASLLMPTIGASYRVLPQLDVGARFSLGFAKLSSKSAAWGNPDNYEENIKKDGYFSIKADDAFIPVWGLGATYRPTPAIELGAAFNSQININAKGTARAEQGTQVEVLGQPIVVLPINDGREQCQSGGTRELQRACIALSLPRSVLIGGRYKFLGADGQLRGDVELDLGWENWSADRVTTFTITVDAEAAVRRPDGTEDPFYRLKPTVTRHELKDTYSARLGGSFHVPVGANKLIFRGGVAYDTAAARKGWMRIDIDGAARTTTTLGVGFRTNRFEINLGGGAVFEGTNSNPGTCNPTISAKGCAGTNTDAPIEDRGGLDPINPSLEPELQAESPVTQGIYKSHYVLLMLGASTWF